jgi:hypothetical protein
MNIHQLIMNIHKLIINTQNVAKTIILRNLQDTGARMSDPPQPNFCPTPDLLRYIHGIIVCSYIVITTSYLQMISYAKTL